MPRVYGPDGNWIDFPEGTDQQTIKDVMARYYGGPGQAPTAKLTTYEIQAPNGKTYRIDGPPGATQEEVQAAILRNDPSANLPKRKEASLGPVSKGGHVSKANDNSLSIHAQMPDGTTLVFPNDTSDAVIDRTAKEYIASANQTPPATKANGEQFRTITVTYEDGSRHVYQNAPANLTAQQVIERSKRDGDKQIILIEDRPQASRATAPDKAFSANTGTDNRFDQPITHKHQQAEWPHWVTGNVIAASVLALAALLFLIARAAMRTRVGNNFVNALSNSRAIRLAASNAKNLRWIGLIGAGAFMLTGAFVWPEGVEIELSSRRIADGPLLRSVIYTFPSAPFAIAIGTMLAAAAWLFRPAKTA